MVSTWKGFRIVHDGRRLGQNGTALWRGDIIATDCPVEKGVQRYSQKMRILRDEVVIKDWQGALREGSFKS